MSSTLREGTRKSNENKYWNNVVVHCDDNYFMVYLKCAYQVDGRKATFIEFKSENIERGGMGVRACWVLSFLFVKT